jgi:hypothetical protein
MFGRVYDFMLAANGDWWVATDAKPSRPVDATSTRRRRGECQRLRRHDDDDTCSAAATAVRGATAQREIARHTVEREPGGARAADPPGVRTRAP